MDVYGHSGGLCAFGAATLTNNIRALVLYEGWPLVNVDAFVLPQELQRGQRLAADDGEAGRGAGLRHYSWTCLKRNWSGAEPSRRGRHVRPLLG